jgi:hypothetical protein
MDTSILNPSRTHLGDEFKSHNFEVTHSKHPNLEIIPTMSMFQHIEHVVIPVIHKTHKDLLLEQFTPIAEISAHLCTCKKKAHHMCLF